MSIPDKPINPENAEKFERIRQFQRYRLVHSKLNWALDQARMAIDYEDEPTVILLYGPSGAGKTTLIEHLMALLMEEHAEEMANNPGHIPVTYVRTMSPSKREFNWKYFYYLANQSLNDPFAFRKKLYRLGNKASGNPLLTGLSNDVTEIQYVDSLLSNIKNRGLRVMFIDEAQHLAEGASWQSENKQVNHVKTFTDYANSIIFLCGTYDLLPFRTLNGQLSRRIIEIHLPRYRFNETKDRKCFERILEEFQNAMPFDKKPDLVSHSEFLYMHSVGCVGVLKKWLNRAVIFAVSKNHPTITLTHLNLTLKDVAACEKMSEDIQKGEMKLAESSKSTARLRFLLGMDEPESEASLPTALGQKGKPKKRKSPVGRRNPVRDKIGKQD